MHDTRAQHSAGETATQAARIEGIDLRDLAARLGTPLHVYSARAIRERVAQLRSSLDGLDALICFAVKANPNAGILQLMSGEGLGADVVSGGELRRSLRAGIPAARIVFSGVGKTDVEMSDALAAGILRFNVESRDELDALQRVAAQRGVVARAAARINPDVDAGTHAKISTGKAENKFGVPIAEARAWFARTDLPNVRLDGLHVHIGSQIVQLEPFRRALEQVADFARELAAHGHPVESIDVGGGLGVCYRAGHDRPIPVTQYADAIRTALYGFSGKLVLEPGRWLVAEAGVLLTRVIRVKHGLQGDFLVLDAAMTELQRPSLYDAWHDIEPVVPRDGASTPYDVVGPVCESADTFARARLLPPCAAGDLMIIRTTGAYGASMASTYNSRPLAAEVLVDDRRYALIRRRQTIDEIMASESAADAWSGV